MLTKMQHARYIGSGPGSCYLQKSHVLVIPTDHISLTIQCVMFLTDTDFHRCLSFCLIIDRGKGHVALDHLRVNHRPVTLKQHRRLVQPKLDVFSISLRFWNNATHILNAKWLSWDSNELSNFNLSILNRAPRSTSLIVNPTFLEPLIVL